MIKKHTIYILSHVYKQIYKKKSFNIWIFHISTYEYMQSKKVFS